MDFVNRLVKNPRFWIAIFALAQTIIFQYIPNFPPAIWQSIDAVAAIVFLSITAENSATKLGQAMGQSLSDRGMQVVPDATIKDGIDISQNVKQSLRASNIH